MAKLAEELWHTLQDLEDGDFRHFKWFLKQDNIIKDSPGIPVARLEKAERQDTVDLMVQKYQGPGALKLTLIVLEKISRNDLVQRLQNSSSAQNILKNHDSALLKSDYERQKEELGNKIKLMIQERQTKIREIECSAKLSSKSADRHIADSQEVFSVLLQAIQRSLADLIEAINEKRKTTQKEADGYIQELKQEISELTKQLSSTDNHPNFLQDLSPSAKNWTEVTIPRPSYGKNMWSTVNQLQEKITEEKNKLIAKAELNKVQEFAKDVTLDPETANSFLVLSDYGKQVYCGDVKQNLPDNPKRFDTARNVLGRQSFSTGRFYYEVQVKGNASWDLGVVKESINRKGSIRVSPKNGYWTIGLRGDKYKASGAHITVKRQPQKVGVFVEFEKGSVSFYDVDSADIIHRFSKCSFTEKLLPFFSPSCHQSGTNSTPLIISPVNYTD
ncbi:zinc-binding protein A33-like [Symphorus nematophorus]